MYSSIAVGCALRSVCRCSTAFVKFHRVLRLFTVVVPSRIVEMIRYDLHNVEYIIILHDMWVKACESCDLLTDFILRASASYFRC